MSKQPDWAARLAVTIYETDGLFRADWVDNVARVLRSSPEVRELVMAARRARDRAYGNCQSVTGHDLQAALTAFEEIA